MQSELDVQEIIPVLLCRIEGGEMRCALWTPAGGSPALALFLDASSASAYQQDTGLDDTWQQYQPARSDLLEILRQMYSAGVKLAVLDPDKSQAKRLFDLQKVLQETGLLEEDSQ